MSNTVAKNVLLIVLLGLVCFSSAAPVKDAVEADGAELNPNTDTNEEQITDTESQKPSTTDESPEAAGDDDANKEVTNYHSIEVDGNSKVEGQESMPEKDGTVLSAEEADELLQELSNPVDVAQFIVSTDDARGFLEALRLLTDQDYITLKMAYYLRDRVMDELRRMLMIQEMELSRTLLNNYDTFTQEQLTNSEPPAPYYDDAFTTYVTPDELYPQVPYELYEENLRQENSRALAEIAEAVAQKISTGQLTSQDGVKIMNTVASLLPDSYWQDALEVFSDGEGGYTLQESDYSQESVGSDVIELLGDEEEEDEDESLEEQDSSEEDAELEKELRNKNMENVLEKQLVNKAHINDQTTQSEEEELTHQENTVNEEPELVEIDQPELTEEDYQAFFDWLEKAMLDMPVQEGEEPVMVKVDDDEEPSKDLSAESNDS